MLDAQARVPLRRDGRRAARCVQRNRAGLGVAAVAVGGHGAQRLRLDAATRPPQASCSTASASIIWSALPHLYPAARYDGRSRSSRRPTKPRNVELGERLVAYTQRRRRDHRRGSRHGPRFRPRIAAAWGPRFQGHSMGTRVGPPVSRSSTRRVYSATRLRRPAHTTPNRWRPGGRSAAEDERRLIAGGSVRRAAFGPRQPTRSTRMLRALLEAGSASRSSRCRTCSGGRNESTRRRSTVARTGAGVCRGTSIASTDSPAAGSGESSRNGPDRRAVRRRSEERARRIMIAGPLDWPPPSRVPPAAPVWRREC